VYCMGAWLSKIITVFGATGNHGGSGINTILEDPRLLRNTRFVGLLGIVRRSLGRNCSSKVLRLFR
ncbi:hypothetical protein AFLA70_542g000760, partial [Aspergillus flavus AF70]